MQSYSDILARLEEAELQLNRWIADGKSLEICDELADMAVLAALANDYRAAVHSGDTKQLEFLTRRARKALLVKSDADRSGTLLLFGSNVSLAERLTEMYIDFATDNHCTAAPVDFSDGLRGLCIRSDRSLFDVHLHLKNETGTHRAGNEQCAVCAIPLPQNISSEGYHIEAFAHPEDRRFHRFPSCVRAGRDGLTCESLSLRTAYANRDIALAALTARPVHPVWPTEQIRSYEFSIGTLTDLRIKKSFSTGNLLPLFESLLLAE